METVAIDSQNNKITLIPKITKEDTIAAEKLRYLLVGYRLGYVDNDAIGRNSTALEETVEIADFIGRAFIRYPEGIDAVSERELINFIQNEILNEDEYHKTIEQLNKWDNE